MHIKERIKNIISILKTKEKIAIYTPIREEDLLKGKTALITGGSGGIGQAIADELIRLGCFVVLSGTNEHKLKKICDSKNYCSIDYIVLNVRDISSFPDVIKKTCNISPNGSIDILINNAGINDTKQFLDVDESTYNSILDVNLKGAFFLSQSVAKTMISEKTHGHILNISSASSLRPASQPYAISKWALTGMTKGLADELIRYGIIVNAIAPGPTATPMLGKHPMEDISHTKCPIGRYAVPQEIAKLAGFMVSKYGELIIGDTIYITGGSGTVSLHR